VTDSSGLFLAIIAVSTLVMALVQIGAILAVLRVAKQVTDVLVSVQRDLKPLMAKANDIVGEASRTVTLATAQAQKVDKLVTDLTRRVDETSALVQKAIVAPAREGIAIVAAVKAALGVFRGLGDFRGRPGRAGEEEDPLFIG
jgi:hypothetical protein